MSDKIAENLIVLFMTLKSVGRHSIAERASFPNIPAGETLGPDSRGTFGALITVSW